MLSAPSFCVISGCICPRRIPIPIPIANSSIWSASVSQLPEIHVCCPQHWKSNGVRGSLFKIKRVGLLRHFPQELLCALRLIAVADAKCGLWTGYFCFPTGEEGERKESRGAGLPEGKLAHGDSTGNMAQGVTEQVAEHEGGCFEIVGREDNEEGAFAQELAANVEQVGELLFHFPDFAVGTASEGWRVEEDGLVAAPTADFAVHIFDGVFENPSDGFGSESRELLVVSAPVDGRLCGVHVGDGEAGLGCDKTGDAGVAEEVE